MTRIIVIGNLKSRVSDQIILCEKLIKINPQLRFLFVLNDPESEQFFKNKDFRYYTIKTVRAVPKQPGNSNIESRVKSKLSKNQITNIIKSIQFFSKLCQKYKICRRIITDFKPDLIIANDDRYGEVLLHAVLKCAKELKIKVLIPYMVYSDQEGSLKIREKSQSDLKYKKSLVSDFIARQYPSHLQFLDKTKYFFYPVYVSIALHFFGTLPSNPWYIGNGISDIVCVDNYNTLTRYSRNGVPADKMRVVGDTVYDRLFMSFSKRESIKKDIAKKYKLDSRKKILIISLPQLAEHNLISWDLHWKEIKFLMETLSDEKINILVSLHPKSEFGKYRFIEEDYKCHIVKERLYDILPVADVFIATFSSTVIWSVLCGINTIVVDFYDMGYSIFDFLRTVEVVRKKKDLKNSINASIGNKKDFSSDWKKVSKDIVFDGNTIKRYNDLINKITEINDSENHIDTK